MTPELIALIAVSCAMLLSLGANVYLWYAESDTPAPRNIDSELEKAKKELTDGLLGLNEAHEKMKANVSRLELEVAELTEFVSRNLKKMSTRAARAEELNALMDQAKELDRQEDPDLFRTVDPNRKPKLMRPG